MSPLLLCKNSSKLSLLPAVGVLVVVLVDCSSSKLSLFSLLALDVAFDLGVDIEIALWGVIRLVAIILDTICRSFCMIEWYAVYQIYIILKKIYDNKYNEIS